MHSYHIKGRPVWEVQIAQASCIIQEILKAKDTFIKAGYIKDLVIHIPQFSIRRRLSGEFQKVPWRRVL